MGARGQIRDYCHDPCKRGQGPKLRQKLWVWKGDNKVTMTKLVNRLNVEV